MPWAQSSAGVEEWVGPDPPAVILGRGRLVTAPATEAPAPPRKLSLAEQIAATRAKQAAATAEAAPGPSNPLTWLGLGLGSATLSTKAAPGLTAPAI